MSRDLQPKAQLIRFYVNGEKTASRLHTSTIGQF